jgi:hypothetical protein
VSNLWANVEDLGDYAESDFAYDAVKTASYVLWALSGRKYSGITTVTERYVSQFDPYFRTAGSGYKYLPTLIEGNVQNLPVGRDLRVYGNDYLGDGTSSRSRVRLRGRKVITIHTVRDNSGNIVDPNKYYLADHSTLYGTPGANWTPTNVEVTYSYGTPPPSAGRAAARLLARELVKLYEGDDTCALPQRVTSVSRQGINYSILDDQDFLDNMRVGIYAVDLFLKSVNPDKARARARVFSPDVPRARRITPKDPAMPRSDFDLYITPEGGAVLLYLDEIGGDFLIDDTSWVLSVVVSDWSNEKTETLVGASSLDRVDGTIRISASYQDIKNVLGAQNPGVLDLYATRPSLGNPQVDEVINLISSNVIYQLGERVIPISIAE